MTEKTRISLPTDLATRDATVSHDGILQNLYEENTPIGPMIVKRPGLTNNIALGPCVAQGSTFFNGNNYFICSNVLYSNPPPQTPPVCGIPGTPMSFGNANNNYYAVIDPVTKNIWASEFPNIHKVAVYNSTTGALITEITIPTTSGDTIALFYNASTRKIFASSQVSIGGLPNIFVFNPDTFLIEQSIAPAGGNAWGSLCLDNATTNIVGYNGGGGNITVNYVGYGTTVNTYPSTGVDATDYVYASDIPAFAVLAPGHVSIISDFGAVKAFNDFAVDQTDGARPPVAYDSLRKYFWVFERTTHKLYFIPAAGPAIGSLTFVATLPANPLQVCYDPGRDVLWSTFEDGTVRKISPKDGSILGSFPGASTFNFSTLRGTRLFLRDSCTLIQGTGGSLGTAFFILGIQ